MTGEHEHDHQDLAREIHATRAEPRPEFARELDERAAAWLREPSRRRFPSPRFTLRAVAAAASAAALVVALVIASGDGGGGGGGEGGDRLEVAVVAEGTPGAGGTRGTAPAPAAPEALEAAPQRDSSQGAGGGAFLLLTVEGDTVTVRYLFPQATAAKVALAGREAEVTIGPGAGSLEVSTEDLPAGSHELTIATPAAPTYRQPVQIDR